MPTIQIEAQLSPDALFEAARQLEPGELEQLTARLQTLHTGAPVLSAEESALMLAINQGLSPDERARFDALVKQRRNAAITPVQERELMDLSAKSEKLNAERIKALGQLARLRGTTLDGIMAQLGIRAPEVLD